MYYWYHNLTLQFFIYLTVLYSNNHNMHLLDYYFYYYISTNNEFMQSQFIQMHWFIYTTVHVLTFSLYFLLSFLSQNLHCKMKRANLAPKMGPKRVSPEWYCFGGQFSPTEMGLFWYQNLGLNWPLHRGQIRPCKGSIWKTRGPFWIFQ